MSKQLVQTEAERLIELEECEVKIFHAYRRGLEAICEMAKQFRRIIDKELYRERGCDTFEQYAQIYLNADERMIERTFAVAKVIENLRGAGLKLPTNEFQAAELARLDEAHQPMVWERLLQVEEKVELPVTISAVKQAVDQAREAIAAEAQAQTERKGVQTALDMEGPSGTSDGEVKKMTPAKVPDRAVKYDEQGEAALERIKRLCGAVVAKAIESGNLPMSQRDLIKWSEEEDSMVTRLAHYVNDLRWKVDKAIAFENAEIDEATTLTKVREMTLARGGRMSFRLEDLKVSTEQVA